VEDCFKFCGLLRKAKLYHSSNSPSFDTTIPIILSYFHIDPSIRDGVLRSGMLLYLHHRDSKIFFHPAKFDNFKDEKISDFKTVSVSQRKNLLD